jgi:hypothetical protein
MEDFMYRTLSYPSDIQYSVCKLALIDAIVRVDKRRHYFKVFHNMDINEGKRAALLAYWIVKFRPIMITDVRYINTKGYNDRVNELFALHILLIALRKIKRVKFWDGSSGVKVELDHPYLKELRYSLRFRNFTIDSMLVLADSITTETFSTYSLISDAEKAQ